MGRDDGEHVRGLAHARDHEPGKQRLDGFGEMRRARADEPRISERRCEKGTRGKAPRTGSRVNRENIRIDRMPLRAASRRNTPTSPRNSPTAPADHEDACPCLGAAG